MAPKYLRYFPKPLLDDFLKGRWLPVVGAGMSLNAEVPLDAKMPLWRDLGRFLEGDLSDYSSNSVLDSISEYEHAYGRPKLIERLSELLLVNEARPGDTHREFCLIPFDIVCTTNFDFLLERQYQAIPRPARPLIEEAQLSINMPEAGTLLFKLHGDLDHPHRLVATEADYDEFLSKYPMIATYLANLLITKTAVFIGYSLDDPDFRQVWQVVAQRLGKHRRAAYAIAVNASASDVSRFSRRGVRVINLPGKKGEYGAVLQQTFHELREFMREKVISVSKVTEEAPLRELMLPRSAENRLCFFSLPLDLLPVYREVVFPVVRDVGFVPITADDVIVPGDNIVAKLDSLIDRASVMVVDVSTKWTQAEFEMATARLKNTESVDRPPLRLIVVSEHIDALSHTENVEYLERPNLVEDDPEGFLTKLADVLLEVAERSGGRRALEPQRLLDAREYRAAVISAMTYLESELRERLGKVAWTDVRRPASLGKLVSLAVERQQISPQAHDNIRSWMTLRNEAVHTAKPVSREQAVSVVSGVLRALKPSER